MSRLVGRVPTIHMAAMIETGDLIFVRPSLDAASALDEAILATGNATIRWLREHGISVQSNATASHVALAWRNGSGLSVIEAVAPTVRLTPWRDFVVSWPGAQLYRASLSHEPSLRPVGQKAARLALSQLGVPYSKDFLPPPRAFYCSSLVDWAFVTASSDDHILITTHEPFRLIFVPHSFWERYYQQLNQTLPPANATGSNPTLLLHSPHVRFAALPPPSPPPQTRPLPTLSTASPTASPTALLSAAFVGGGHPDLRRLAVVLDGSVFWPPGSLSFLQGGVWHGGDDLIEHAAVARQRGRDRLGSFVRSSATYRIGAASGAIVELAVRSYDCGRRLVFEQRFPQGLNASSSKPRLATTPSAVVGLAPLSSWPAFELTAGGTARTYAWRSWHGTYGSYSGVGLNSKDTIVFNGVPTMPLLFMSPPDHNSSSGPDTSVCVVISPLSRFKAAAHAATEPLQPAAASSRFSTAPSSSPSLPSTSWRHGPSSRFPALPAGFASEVLLVASTDGPTHAMRSWGGTMKTWHRTDRTEAIARDRVVRTLGVWTDNGAFYNFNKWAGNSNVDWSPQRRPAQAPERVLARAIASLRRVGVRPGYLQLDDWYYEGVVYEGAVSCVRNWSARHDWFPSGLKAFSERLANIPLLLYMPYLCNDTAYRTEVPLAIEDARKARRGGVPDRSGGPAAGCSWPNNRTCTGRYALPAPGSSEAFYRARFAQGLASGMIAFEHDFVGQDSLDFGWASMLPGAGSAWLQGMGRAASSVRMPTQLCLATASDLLESLTMNWVTNARASGDYAFCADSWDIGFSGLLHWAVGVRPFKDVFWSTPSQPGSPYDNTTLFPSMYRRCFNNPRGTHAQPNVQLDALISAFSTGPVGIGDGEGYTDARLVLATCRADGILLPPSKPLSPLDRTWWPPPPAPPHALPIPPSWLLGSYSRVGTVLWQYVLAVDAPCETTRPVDLRAELYWPPEAKSSSGDVEQTASLDASSSSPPSSYAVLRWGAACTNGEPAYSRSSCVSFVDKEAHRLHVCTPGAKFPNGTHAWALATLAPVLPGGWALLGESDKFVRASPSRFAAVDGKEPAVLRMELDGMPGETVTLVLVTPPLPTPASAAVLVLEAAMRAPRMACNVSAASKMIACEPAWRPS